LRARTTEALDELATDHPDAELLVVTHGGVVYVLEADAGLPFARLPNLSGRWLAHHGNRIDLGERVELVDEAGPGPDRRADGGRSVRATDDDTERV